MALRSGQYKSNDGQLDIFITRLPIDGEEQYKIYFPQTESRSYIDSVEKLEHFISNCTFVRSIDEILQLFYEESKHL